MKLSSFIVIFYDKELSREVVTLVDVDDEDRVGKSLVIKLNFCSDFEHKVWSRF